jgi:DNA adenine methylase
VLPFLKWAGGKRWLVQSGQLKTPNEYNRLVEPFLGGAAVFFGLEPTSALLSDVNPDLIELYEVVRDYPAALELLMRWHQEKHSHEHYYQIRARTYRDPVWKAARTLYLNRTCWNGLYRVNRRGEFNVPVGTKSLVIAAGESFQGASELLLRSILKCQDFEPTIDECAGGDFLFVDPPYTVKHNLNGFLKYNETIFSWDDQVRLRDACVRAALRGAHVVVTNADHESVRTIYTGVAEYQRVGRASVLAGNSDFRSRTTEAVFLMHS